MTKCNCNYKLIPVLIPTNSSAATPLIYYLLHFQLIHSRIRRRTEGQIIHPESEANVQNTRTHLQEQNRLPPPREPTAPPLPENRQRQEGEITCPVCIANAQFAVETNCGHIFCGMFI